MKKLSLNVLLSLMMVIGLMTSCAETDLPGGGNDAGPTSSLVVEADFVSDDTTVPASSTFKIKINAQKGDSPLNSLEIRDNAGLVDLGRLSLTANPELLFDLDKEGLVREIEIVAQDGADIAETYTIRVTDEAGKSTEVSVIVTTVANVTELTGKLLLNAGGPVGTGGINLKTGEGTGSQDAEAHIKDEGIDTDLVLAENWIQKISGVNGSELKYAATGLVFADVLTQGQVQAAFDDANATAFTVSDKIMMGDLIVVKNGEDYFLVRVSDVVITPDNNEDYYELSIKF